MERMKAVLTLSAAILFVSSPFYAGAFGGFEPSQFPVPQVDPPVVPAGYAFSIWGLIYVLLLVHAVFGLLKRDEDPFWDKTRWPLIVSLGVGASWIPVAQISPLWATVLIWIMLVSALMALFRTGSGRDRFVLKTPLALYAGWLTAASFVSAALLGAGYGILTDAVGWAWLGLGFALALACAVQWRLGNTPEYGLAVAWALVAVCVRNWTTQPAIAVFAIFGGLVIAALAFRMRGLASR